MNPANVSDLQDRWRPLTTEESDAAQYLLDDAWAELVLKVSRLEERITDGTLPARLAVKVVCAMVKRVLLNPEGIRQETHGEYTYVRDQALSTGALYATADEVALLIDGSPRPKAFSMPV